MKQLAAFLVTLMRLVQDHQPAARRADAKQSNGDHSKHIVPKLITAELRLPEGVVKQLAAGQQKEETRAHEILCIERRRLRVEKWALGIAGFSSFCTLVTLGFLYLSVEEARKAAEAASAGAAAAERAANIASDSLIVQNRPWLFFERRKFHAHEADGISAEFVVQNGGHTPALAISGCVTFEILNITEAPHFAQKPCQQIEIQALRQGEKDSEVVTLIRMYRPNVKPVALLKPDHQTMLAITKGRMLVSAHGRFAYRDVFDVEHWAQFCDVVYYNGPPLTEAALAGPLGVCAKYNAMDSNTKKPDQGQPKDQP